MSNRSLAKRYARALFSIAEEENLIEQFNSELEAFSEAFSHNDGELLTALTTPVFKLQERKQVVTVLSEKMGVHVMVQNFMFLLLEKERIALHFEIAQVFQSMTDAKAGRVRARVQTAQELSEAEQTEIRSTLAQSIQTTPENLVIEFSVNEGLIGGVWAKVGDTTYDATIRSKLQDMKVTLLN